MAHTSAFLFLTRIAGIGSVIHRRCVVTEQLIFTPVQLLPWNFIERRAQYSFRSSTCVEVLLAHAERCRQVPGVIVNIFST